MNQNQIRINRGTIVLNIISAVIISVIINLSIKLTPVFEIGAGALVMDWGLLKPSFIIKIIVIALDALVIIYLLKRIVRKWFSQTADSDQNSAQKDGSKAVFIRAFIMCVLIWGVCLVVFFPGASMNDVINGLMSAASTGNMQPFLYMAYVHYVFAFGQRIFHGDGALSFALLTLSQILFCAFCVSYNTVWLYRRSLLTGKWTVLYPLFFCLMPIIADYSITVVKDVPFSFALLVFIPVLYETMEDHTRQNWFLFAFSAFIIWFSRSNGKYLIIFAILAVLLVFQKNVRKLLLILALMLVLDKGVTAVQVSLNPWDCFLRESTSVILNQISAVVAAEGNISPEDKEFISHIVPYEKWREYYRPSNVDLLKFQGYFDNYFLNAHKRGYLKAWARIVRDNPEICVKAYVIHTYGLWAAVFEDPKSITQSVFTKVLNNISEESNWYQWLKEQNALNRNILPAELNQKLQKFYFNCFKANIAVRPGVFLIVMILLLNICSEADDPKKKRLWIVFMILFLNWGTQMAAIPVSTIYRYSFYWILTLPMMILFTILGLKKEMPDTEDKNGWIK